MTQTEELVYDILRTHNHANSASAIAAWINRLERERDEAKSRASREYQRAQDLEEENESLNDSNGRLRAARDKYLKELTEIKEAMARVMQELYRLPSSYTTTFVDLPQYANAVVGRAIDKIDTLQLKADAWDAHEALLAADGPDVPEVMIFPLIFAYEEAAKRART